MSCSPFYHSLRTKLVSTSLQFLSSFFFSLIPNSTLFTVPFPFQFFVLFPFHVLSHFHCLPNARLSHTLTHTHAHTHTLTCTNTRTRTHTHTHALTCTHTHTIHTHTHTHSHAHTHTIHTHTHTHMHTHRPSNPGSFSAKTNAISPAIQL